VADWPAGKPGDFPVGPCFKKFFGPPIVHANLSHWQSVDTVGRQAQHSAHGSRRAPCESEWTNDGDVSYSFTCRLPPSRIKTISDGNKKAILPFLRP